MRWPARFGLGDGEAIFIDDNPANVEGAVAAGWHAHRFTIGRKPARPICGG
jgi:FMN phosphatase YigB (HAD superfamily)